MSQIPLNQASPVFVPLDYQSTNFDQADSTPIKHVLFPTEENNMAQFKKLSTSEPYITVGNDVEPMVMPLEHYITKPDHILPNKHGCQPANIPPNDQLKSLSTSAQPSTNFGPDSSSEQGVTQAKMSPTKHGYQPAKIPPNDQVQSPSTRPSTRFDQNIQREKEPALVSSQQQPEETSLLNFHSVVPPVLIPLSKVGPYLPQGTTMSGAAWIPLALKPAIVLRDDVAVMVFVKDNGECYLKEKFVILCWPNCKQAASNQ